MLRSLSAGISGLQNHQTRMDIIGNNIANVNTTGYKSGRVTFEESFSQLLQGASRPPGSGGGTNPLQVGLGMGVGSIDTLTAQGNLESTGRVLDLAIQGSAYFGVSDGKGTYYSRNGGFQLDANGKVVLPTNGMILQGKMADVNGEFPAGTVIGDISVPFNEQSPAKATEAVQFSRNLDSESDAKGSVIYSQRFLHAAKTTDTLTTMYNGKGTDLGMKDGDQITIGVNDASLITVANPTGLVQKTLIVGGTDPTTGITSIQDLATQISGLMGASPANIIASGALQITPTANYTNLQVTSNNPLSNSALNKAFNVPSNLLSGVSVTTDTLKAPAIATDRLVDVYDSSGQPLAGQDALGNYVGMQNGDVIDITGLVGKDTANSFNTNPLLSKSITFADGTGVPPATTMADILSMARDTLKLPTTDGTVQENPTVSMNSTLDDGIPDGSIVFRGAKGTAFALNNITIRATNQDNQNPAPTLFNSNTSFTDKQKAQDVGVFDTSITVYDDTGEEHILNMTYVHTSQPGVWNWKVGFNGKESITQGSSGQVTFGQDGSVAAFTYTDNSSSLVVDPNNGSKLLKIDLDVGGPGNFQGLTQFSSPTTVSAVKQDGYTTGNLQDISIDESGFISGSFSNGTARKLAQIQVVDFTNPGGLQRVSDSVYAASSNSGDPVYGAPGTQSSSTIKPGALEMSNVDLAAQFTDMITTQRGYQANARIITVSDTMLEELVALKR